MYDLLHPLPSLTLVLVIGLGAVYDWRDRRVPTRLFAAGAVLGALFATFGLTVSLWQALLGFLLLGGIGTTLQWFGMGGGDTEMFALLGFFYGPLAGLHVMMMSYVINGMAALVLLAGGRKRLKDTLPMVPGIFLAVLLWRLGITFW